MKHSIILLLIFFGSQTIISQIYEPVKWSTSVEMVSEKEAVLVATAKIDDNWHLYSQTVPEDGPIATIFSFEGNKSFLKKGNTKEEDGTVVEDPIFDIKIKYFSNKATFRQPIRLKTKEPFTVKGTVEFMVCDESKCLPPAEVDLEYVVNN